MSWSFSLIFLLEVTQFQILHLSVSSFWVNFVHVIRIQFHPFACGYPVFPALFIEGTIFSPIDYSCHSYQKSMDSICEIFFKVALGITKCLSHFMVYIDFIFCGYKKMQKPYNYIGPVASSLHITAVVMLYTYIHWKLYWGCNFCSKRS